MEVELFCLRCSAYADLDPDTGLCWDCQDEEDRNERKKQAFKNKKKREDDDA